MTWIYWIANLCGMVGIAALNVAMFGRENSRVYKWPKWQSTTLRISMLAVMVGHAYCVIDMGKPTFGEAVLACGLGFIFPWTAWYHWNIFVVKYREGLPFRKEHIIESDIS